MACRENCDSNLNDILTKVLPLTVGGGTNTASGLNQAAATLYAASSGARQDAKKVAVLVTDGRSNSFSGTQSAAEALKVSVLLGLMLHCKLEFVSSDVFIGGLTLLCRY